MHCSDNLIWDGGKTKPDAMTWNQAPIVVSIRCLVYNHAPYIRQCLDGFVMQKTNFRFKAIVHDDASTDESAAIIREYSEKYPEIITPIFEERNCYRSTWSTAESKIRDEYKGKFLAFCEGDDFWTDPYKLMKQVRYFSTHHNVSLVHTAFSTVDDNSDLINRPIYDHFINISKSGDRLAFLLSKGNYILTCSSMLDINVIKSPELEGLHSMLDYGFFLVASLLGNVGFIQDKTCSYRLNTNSVMHTNRSEIYEITKNIFLDIRRIYMSGHFKRKGMQHYKVLLSIAKRSLLFVIKK